MASLVWVRDVVSGRLCSRQLTPGSRVRELLPGGGSGAACRDFYVRCNGRKVSTDEELQDGLVYSVEARLCGGKGGFGSMLRALGAQIEKTTNREACRDLSGRRLRDVNHEKAMAEWIKKQAEREAEKEQRRQERLKRKLAEPKHYFNDPEYSQQCSDMSERLEESVIKGLQASSSSVVSADSGDSRKRRKIPLSSKGTSNKKQCLWLGVEGLDVSSSSGSDSDSESPSTSASSGNSVSGQCRSESDSDGPEQSSSSADQRGPEQSETSAEANIEPIEAENPVSSDSTASEPSPEEMGTTSAIINEVTSSEEPACSSGQTSDSPGPEKPADTTDSPEKPADTTDSPEKSADTTDSPEKPADTTDSPEKPADTTDSPGPEKPADTSAAQDPAVFDLLSFTSAAELETLGMEKLKVELAALGLKCGGTLQERAARLFSVRGLSRDQIDPALFPKPSKGKKK